MPRHTKKDRANRRARGRSRRIKSAFKELGKLRLGKGGSLTTRKKSRKR